MSGFAFIVIAFLIITGALITVIAANAVHAALGLVATLVSLAMMYVTLEAHFLAATQVIVYAGAIMVLFLFVIMLLDAARPVRAVNPIPFVTEVAAGGGVLLAAAFGLLALSWRAPLPAAAAAAKLAGGAPYVIGQTLLSRFVLPFEAVSILLLVAVVGSVILIRRPAPQDEPVPEAKPVEGGERVGA